MGIGDVRSGAPVPRPRQQAAGPNRDAAGRRLVAAGPVSERLDRLVRHTARRLSAAGAEVSLLAGDEEVLAAACGARPTGSCLTVDLRDPAGDVVGWLCAFDAEGRGWTDEQTAELADIGELVAAELDDHAGAGPAAAAGRARLAAEAAELGSFVYSTRGAGRLDWDERMLALHGFTPASFDGTFAAWQSRVHPDDLPGLVTELEVAQQAAGEIACEYRVVVAGAEPRWVRVRGRVMPELLGRPTQLVGAAYDASTELGLRDELVRLTETMPTALVRIGRDWTFTYVNALAEGLYGRTRAQLVGVNIYEAFPEVRGSVFDEAYTAAMSTGRPGTVEAYFEPLDTTFEVRVWPDEQGLTLFFHDVSERVRAQTALQRAGERLQLLADVGARLARSLLPREVLDVLADVVVPRLAESLAVAVTGAVAELLGQTIVADVERLYPVRVVHVDPAAEQELTAVMSALDLRLSGGSGVGSVARSGEVERHGRIPAESLRARASSQAQYEQMMRLNSGPRLTLPLTAPGGVLGAFTVSGSDDTGLDEVLLLDLATRTAVALENALSFTRQHQAATVLQRALLPREPPVLPGVAVATRYLPARAHALAGGDFFKTVDVDGTLVCALGDVMGHGTASAARAGQLHGLVAALALQGLGPGELLGRLAGGIDQMMELQLATLLICSYDPATRRLTAASAGHPPPLVVPVLGDAGYLDVDPGPPIGVAHGVYREQIRTLRAGATVLLFSDGLVERRGESLTEGLERLRAAVDGLDAGPEQLCDRVLAALRTDASGSDDIALLALRQE